MEELIQQAEKGTLERQWPVLTAVPRAILQSQRFELRFETKSQCAREVELEELQTGEHPANSRLNEDIDDNESFGRAFGQTWQPLRQHKMAWTASYMKSCPP